METINIPRGTLKITLANTSQYIIMALFDVIVAKTNALTQTDIGTRPRVLGKNQKAAHAF